MKAVINTILIVCVVGLVYLCCQSILGPIEFENQKSLREEAIKTRLIDIRKAQLEYRALHNGEYTDNFDTLIAFVKEAKLPFVRKEGVLTDDQLEDGLTEKKAMALINKAKKTGNWKEVEKAGLMNFKRDTMWVSLLDTIYLPTNPNFCADSLRYVPFGNGATFEMAVREDTTRTPKLWLFEAKTPYSVYLSDLNAQELAALTDTQTKLNRYTGMKVGDIESPNNNAGNWE